MSLLSAVAQSFMFTKTWLKFGSTAIGIKTNEGVVLGVEKKLPSKLMEPSKSEKLVEVSKIYQSGEDLTIFPKADAVLPKKK